jgi:hypothetical protein
MTKEEELRNDLYVKTKNLMELEEEMVKLKERLAIAVGEHSIALKLYEEEKEDK